MQRTNRTDNALQNRHGRRFPASDTGRRLPELDDSAGAVCDAQTDITLDQRGYGLDPGRLVGGS